VTDETGNLPKRNCFVIRTVALPWPPFFYCQVDLRHLLFESHSWLSIQPGFGSKFPVAHNPIVVSYQAALRHEGLVRIVENCLQRQGKYLPGYGGDDFAGD